MKKDKGKLPTEFVCVKCDYKCGYPSQYIRHLGTVKHNNNVIEEIEQYKQKFKKKQPETYVTTNILYLCQCGKECEGKSVMREHVDTCKNKDQYAEYIKSRDCVLPEKYERIKPILDEFKRLMRSAAHWGGKMYTTTIQEKKDNGVGDSERNLWEERSLSI